MDTSEMTNNNTMQTNEMKRWRRLKGELGASKHPSHHCHSTFLLVARLLAAAALASVAAAAEPAVGDAPSPLIESNLVS